MCNISLHSHCSIHRRSWTGRPVSSMFSGCGYVLCKRCTVCPTRYRTRHFFNNSNTNKYIATKFEQECFRCVRNEKERVCIAPSCCDEGRINLFGAPRQWKHFRPLFQSVFLSGGVITPQTESNTTPPSPKTEITNILFYILNFASVIKFKM